MKIKRENYRNKENVEQFNDGQCKINFSLLCFWRTRKLLLWKQWLEVRERVEKKMIKEHTIKKGPL